MWGSVVDCYFKKQCVTLEQAGSERFGAGSRPAGGRRWSCRTQPTDVYISTSVEVSELRGSERLKVVGNSKTLRPVQ